MLATHEQSNVSGESSAFDLLLRTVGERALRAETLAAQIEAFVGFGGRLPLVYGLDSLTTWQTAIYERLGAGPGASAFDGDLPDDAIALGLKRYGRILLGTAAEVEEGDHVFGFLRLGVGDRQMLEARREQLEQIHRAADAELDGMFEDEQRARRVLDEVAAGLDRVDPILVYVREVTLTNTPEHNNLLQGRDGRPGRYLLNLLGDEPVTSWSWEARALIFSVYWLRAAGFRGEELNGRQLTPYHLGRFFDATIERYASALRLTERPGSEATAAVKARFLAAARAQLANGHTFHRWVSGITLLKTQDFYPKEQVRPLTLGELAPEVAQQLGSRVRYHAEQPLPQVLREYVEATLEDAGGGAPLHAHPIESLLVHLVSAATTELRSDVGMSRCLRQLGELARVHDEDLAEEANAWTQAEYFCAVVPSDRMVKLWNGSGKQLTNILKAISARMRFNGWHYMPGHFPAERKAPDRHVYTPPGMSDTAEWSDQHHRGHIAARVRYSIRSPGPLVYRGKVFPGFFDLRLMRCEGPPYSLAELQAANRHSMTIGVLFQALLDVVAERRSGFRIEAFTNQWFDEVPWAVVHGA